MRRFVSRSGFTLLLALAFAFGLAVAPTARAQTPADTSRVDTEANEPDAGDPGSIDDGTTGDDGRLELSPRIAPSALYSANRGFGIGGGVLIRNAGWDGSEIGIDVRAQQRFLGAGVSVLTGDPYARRVFGSFTASASTTNRRQFFGVGPFTSGSRALLLSHNEASADASLGVYPFGTTALLVQPSVRLLVDRSGGIRDDSPASLEDLSVASQNAVEPNLGETRTGLSAGLELTADVRDWAAYPRKGAVATVEARRFTGLDAEALTFTRVAATTTGYLPLYDRIVLIGTFTGIVTRQGDADGDGAADPIPYYYLPTLDERVAVAFQQDRLTGRDILAAGLGIRLPVYDFLGVYGIDAIAIGYLGNVYDDVFQQFSPSVGFGQDQTADPDGRASLRPALGLGLGIVNLDKERVVLGALVGVGAGGVTLASLRIAYNLRDSRPLFR
ncbi:MAG TPA: hypothetical protein VF594_09735 [Rubricoccaceae bacterium]